MIGLTNYIFLANVLFQIARIMNKTVICADNNKYYLYDRGLDFFINPPDRVVPDETVRIYYSIIHTLTLQDNIEVRSSNGTVVRSLTWNNQTETYDNI